MNKTYDYYIAGPCDTEHRNAMVNIAKFLRSREKKVYCPWELHIENAWDMSQEDWARKVFDEDIKALNDCEMVIMISYGRISSTGSAWEQGYCYAKDIPVHVIQVNMESTSLMVYCGCNNFVNLDNTYSTMMSELQWIIDHGPEPYHGKCRTVLT